MTLKVKISEIKNISFCEFDLPIEKGIYCLVGANGCGKSTVLSCIAQTVYSFSLQNLNEYDYTDSSRIEFSNGKKKLFGQTKIKNGLPTAF